MLKIYSFWFIFFLFSVPLGVYQSDVKLVATITTVSTRGGIPLWPQWHPAEHQTRRQHTLSPAGLQTDGLQWWQRPRAWEGDREENLPVGEEPVRQVGEEMHPGQRRKETARWGRKEHRQQEQRHGLQRPSAITWPWQLRRHFLACLWGIPWVQPWCRSKWWHREPLWHSTPNPTSLWRVPVKPPRHQPASSSTLAPSQGMGLTDWRVEGITGGWQSTRLQQYLRFWGRTRETSEPGVAQSQESHTDKQSLYQIWTHDRLGWI